MEDRPIRIVVINGSARPGNYTAMASKYVVDELRKLKAASLLTGFRGAPALDIGEIAEIATRLGTYAIAHPEIAEIDINPLVVYPEQEGAVAVDALIVAR